MTANDMAEIWRRDEALDRVGGDETLLQELCQIFLAGYPTLIGKLRVAVMAGDTLGVQQAAHSLKGELSYLSAMQATSIARSMEDMGREGNLSSAPASLAALEQSLALLHLALDRAMGVH
ncbi:MAG TPA: Hpt domain-containing protein [Terriglobales bacterium]|nr:Hpt domain-containing protein [Terriglobales bacterium]